MAEMMEMAEMAESALTAEWQKWQQWQKFGQERGRTRCIGKVRKVSGINRCKKMRVEGVQSMLAQGQNEGQLCI